jgi:DNA-binding transcriptional MerR regulator
MLGAAMPRHQRKPKPRGYVRRSRAKPKTGWSLQQLAQLTSSNARTVRSYLQHGVLPRPAFRGSATRYQRPQLLGLLAILRLRRQEKLSLNAIRKRLTALAASELEAFATEALPAGAVRQALGLAPVPVQDAFAALPPQGAPPSSDADVLSLHMRRWGRIELALGLELHVRDDSSPEVLGLARRLRALCDAGR